MGHGTAQLLLVLGGLAVALRARDKPLGSRRLPGIESPQSLQSTLAQCDFDAPERPFCDWTQPQDDGGEWLRGEGQAPGESAGPPGGSPERRGHYVYPAPGESVQLQSPVLSPAVPELCVEFLYYMYSLSSKAQLAVQVQGASGNITTVWTRAGMQSSAWLLGAATVQHRAQHPLKVLFSATQVETLSITIAMDTVSVREGPCAPCVTGCDFDTVGDLCGWEAVPTGDTEWEQWPGAGELPGVGPEDDFSRPGFGSYMLLDSRDPTRPGTGLLRSPLYQSQGGCLALSFHYTLHGVSPDTALRVFAATPGGGLGPLLLSLSGEHGPSWNLGSTNYTGTADVQFVLQGLYNGKPGLAVDSVRISPCAEVFAQCNFNNAKDPFCGWVQPPGASWEWTNQTTPTEETGPPGDYPHGEGHYIYAEGGSLEPGQSLRLSSRNFCSSAGACVEFYYYMHSIVAVQTQLRVLLEGPSGGAVPLWTRTGVQSKAWLFGAVTVPYGEPQPSKVIFEVIRGSNPYLDVALDNISVRRGPCAAGPGTPAPTAGSSAATAVTVWPGGSTATSPTATSHEAATTHSRPTTGSHQTSGGPRPTPPTSPAPSQGVSTSTGHVVPTTSTQSAHTTVSSATTSGQATTGPTASSQEKPTSTSQTSSVKTTTPSTTASHASPTATSHEAATTHSRPTTGSHQTSGGPRPTPPISTAPSQGVSTSTGHVVPSTSTQSAATSSGQPPSATASHASPTATSTVSTGHVHPTTTGHATSTRHTSVALPSTTASPIPSSLPSSTPAHTGPTSNSSTQPGPATGTAQETSTSRATPLVTTTAGHAPPSTATASAAPPTSPTTPVSHTTPATVAPTSSPTTGQHSTAASQQPSTTSSPARPTTTHSSPDPSNAPQATSGHSPPVTVPRTTGQTSPATAPSASPGYTKPTPTSLTATSPAKPTTATAHVPTTGQASTAHSASAMATSQPAGPSSHATLTPTSQPTPASPSGSQAGPSTGPTSSHTSAAGSPTRLPTSTLVPSPTTRPAAGPTTPIPSAGHASPTTSSPGSPTASVALSTPSVPRTTVAKPTTTTPQPSASTTKSPVPPPDRETCIVSGDPHYATYDGRRFDFMGTCTYLLSAVCEATPGLPAFRVEAANEHRGANTQVSYVKAVRVEVLATRIVLLKARRVTVDGKRVSLPVSLAGGRVSVRLSGTFALVQTDFGLWVRFDGNHHAEVSAPLSYAGRLCGLCGNYNGQILDDNLMPNHTSAGTDADRLGESWQVPDEGDAGCTNTGHPGECDPEIAAEAQKPTSCGILTDPQGPFAACHSQAPPMGALQNCVYDLCGTGGEAGSLCFALQSYADRCAQAGVPVVWRNSSFCPLNCPAGSSYSPCGPACPATCRDHTANHSCPGLPCVEGCVCLEGHLLSGDVCVPVGQCGCTDSAGQYHPVGDSWMGNSNCTERCFCGGPNSITCKEWSCSPVQKCRLQEGLPDCQDTGVAACHVAGDPHYFTFDSTMVSFMGTCTYTLVTVCLSGPDLPPFNITGKNEERGQPEASYLRLVTVEVAGATVTLQKGRRVLIDGQRVRTPIEDLVPGTSITTSGIYVLLETNFGLVVKFDGNHHLEIQLPGNYFGKVCGMCGNFNNDSRDELLMPNGLLAANASQFGNSWKAPGDSDPGCQPDNREDLEPSCSPQQMERLSALCSEILAPKYRPCHPRIDPQPFLQNCLYDLCEYQGMMSVLCDNVQAYVEACRSQGVTSLAWRNSTFCPLPCPPHSHYSECSSPCPATCANLYAPACCQRPTPCVEGCACDRGYVLSDGSCVSMRDCGCLDKGQYHGPGDSWVSPACEERCACLGNGSVACLPFQCLPGSHCALSTTGLRYCRPTKFHQCVVSGDPHYRTFDTFVHHFQGRATYALTRTLAELPAVLEPLAVSGRNLRRLPFHRVSFLREVYISVYGYRVTLMQGRKLAVNGVRVTPPYSPRDGLQITQRGRSLFLQTDFGFSVSFNGRDFAEIVLPSTYQTHVGGLCGNYDGRRNNEYMKPDGTWTRSLNAFGDSWQVSAQGAALGGRTAEAGGHPRARREDAAEEEEESGFELGCSPEQLAHVNGTGACGALSDPQGPFAACHSTVSPDTFQESCVYDLCALLGDAQLLCQDYEAYAQLCQEEAVALGPWREKTSCEISCPAHTTYQPCMTACPASCADMAAPSACEAPCVEGCASDAGYVLSGLESVPYSQCGCSRDSQYYQIKDTFWTEGCAQRCTCRDTNTLECVESSCLDMQVCAVANYTRGCFAETACLSSPCQNEGTCEVEGEAAGGFRCWCLEGYAGSLCEETPLDAPPSSGHLTAILLGVLLPLGVVLLAVTVVLVCLRRHRKKTRKDDYGVFLVPGQEKVPDTFGQKITPF